jgi:hypothetical protein
MEITARAKNARKRGNKNINTSVEESAEKVPEGLELARLVARYPSRR